MSSTTQSRDIVSRWFCAFWGEECDLSIVEKLCSADAILRYSMNSSRQGHYSIVMFMVDFRDAFPDLSFKVVGDLVEDRDIVVIKWEASGTHTGREFHDFNIGPLPRASGKRINLIGHSAIRIEEGKIVEEAVWVSGRKSKLHCIVGGASS